MPDLKIQYQTKIQLQDNEQDWQCKIKDSQGLVLVFAKCDTKAYKIKEFHDLQTNYNKVNQLK